MTYFNAVKYISAAPEANVTAESGILRLLSRLNNPQRRMKYIRLAGSNGKTVCAEMLISVLTKAKYTVGTLRMPLRDEPRENICIGDKFLDMDEFSNYIEEIKYTASEKWCADNDEPSPLTLTKSEIILAAAILAFSRHKCELCIIESDHFGEDPSKHLLPPFAAIICGTIPNDDTAEISRIRSYICRGIQEIVSAPQNSEAYRIISDTCYSINCRLTLPSRNSIGIRRLTFRGTDFVYKGKGYSLKMCGRFQISNAVLVLEAIEMLIRKGFKISDQSILEGLESTHIPAKFEIVSLSPLIIVDSTHTPIAVDTVCDSLMDFRGLSGSKIRLCLPDKDLVDIYISALEARGYSIERIISSDGNYSDLTCEAIVCKTKKALVKRSLEDLNKDTVLLISGDYPFVNSVRYELLATMGF